MTITSQIIVLNLLLATYIHHFTTHFITTGIGVMTLIIIIGTGTIRIIITVGMGIITTTIIQDIMDMVIIIHIIPINIQNIVGLMQAIHIIRKHIAVDMCQHQPAEKLLLQEPMFRNQ
jgi:hypothetical protein